MSTERQIVENEENQIEELKQAMLVYTVQSQTQVINVRNVRGVGIAKHQEISRSQEQNMEFTYKIYIYRKGCMETFINSHRERFFPEVQSAAQLVNTAKDKRLAMDIISMLPSYVHNGASFRDGKYTCPICLADFEKDQLLRKLGCRHNFHASCILTWVIPNSRCPVCRREVSPL